MTPYTKPGASILPFSISLFEREDGLFARGLLLATLGVALSLSLEADLHYSELAKGDFVSVLGWIFPGEEWGSPLPLWLARLLLWTGAPLWILGPSPVRRVAAWMSVAGILLLGSTCWENLPWFRHRSVPPFWLMLLLALQEHASSAPSLAPRWVRQGAVFILATFYGMAGIAKLLGSGWAWGDGVSLQLWFLHFGKEGGWLREWVVASASAARFFASGTLLLELAAFLAIALRWIRPPLGVGLLLLHLGIEQVLGIDFRSNMLLVATVLLPWDTLVRRAIPSSLVPSPSAP